MSLFSHFRFRRQRRHSRHRERSLTGARPQLRIEWLEDRNLPSGNVISGYVFNDLNNNGLLDPGEKGIANVPLELVNAAGMVIATAVSDANGYYQFITDSTISTAPATLQRSASVPSTASDWTKALPIGQFDPALGTLMSVDIMNAGSITSQIKVENLDSAPATITATVSGSLTLSGSGFQSLVTNGSSSKTFNASPFDGAIDFDDPSGHDFGPQTATGSGSFTITAASDLAYFIGTGTVSLTEVAHATSAASGAGNLVAQINTTAAAQVSVVYHYIPSNALKAGTYKIVETSQPAGFLDGKLSSNGNVLPNSVGQHAITVTLTGSDLPQNDFAAIVASSAAGFVYLDTNNNGMKDPGEAGIPGVSITLTGTNDLGSVNVSAVTTGDGSYQFSKLRPGNYSITETEPAGYLHGKNSLGSAGGTLVSDQVLGVALGTGVSGNNYNFGELTPASLSGFVYMDANNDGNKEAGEPGIAGVAITLTGTSDAAPVSVATTTAADGSYQFRNLRPGSYTITETEPAGYLHGKNALGSLGGSSVSDQVMNATLGVGALGNNYDFGELLPGSLSGFVYLDANNNGVKDPGEGGLPNAVVTLGGRDDKGSVNMTASTAADGSYQFHALRPGSYTITETEPAGYVHGKNSLGTPGGTAVSNLVFAVNLDVGVGGLNYNFAELGLSSLAGYVYLDSNGNGVKDPGEPGIGGVAITLVGSNDQGAVNSTTATTADGSYQFRSLRPGSYQIREAEPAGYLHGKNTLGWPGGTILSNLAFAVNLDVQMTGTNYNFAELSPPVPPPSGMILADSFAFPSQFARPDVTILSKLQFLSFNNTVDPNVLAEAGFVDAVYRHVLNRPADTPSLIIWVQQLQSGVSRVQVVSAIWNSAEHRGVEVDRMYQIFLNRSPDLGGRAGWVNALFAGVSEMDMARALLASAEFQTAHADNASYVMGLYATILRRAPSAAETSNWVTALQNGASRDALAVAFMNSAEAFQLLLTCDYTNFLQRAPDPVGNQSWLAPLISGRITPPMLCQSILASDEFFALARAASMP